MDVWLIVITVVSLGVALVMSVIAWRATADARLRAAARVETLRTAAGLGPLEDLPVPSTVPFAATPGPVERSTPPPARAPVEEPALLDFAAEDRGAARPAVPISSGFLATDGPARDGAQHQRGLAAAAALLAVVLAGVLIGRTMSGTPAAAAPSQAPLELLSLAHQREGTGLSVAGLVRNPAPARPVERVSAVVMVFDAQGSFVTSATAPLDFLTLGAGDESPFVVRLQAPPSVARYRVSFRTDRGPMTHVDRRGDPAISPVAAQQP